jgi:two-component system response regulator YesN
MKSEIVIISGYDDFSYAQKAIRFGIVDYLLKPVKPASLLESLERLRARLEIRRQEMAQRSEWIAAFRKTADEIAERVWLLEAEEAEAAVRRFHRTLLDNRPDPHMMRNAYTELLSFLWASLSDKEISGFCPAVPWNVYDRPLPHQCMDDVLTLLKDTMERIRKSRNWGIHQSIQRAVDYMKFRFADETLSLQEVAGQVHMSPAYFSRSFKEEMGESFIQYLTRLRMEKAKQLLEDPNRKTYDIAEEVGYTDYPHFAKVFKKYCGMTPTEYRKRLGVL